MMVYEVSAISSMSIQALFLTSPTSIISPSVSTVREFGRGFLAGVLGTVLELVFVRRKVWLGDIEMVSAG